MLALVLLGSRLAASSLSLRVWNNTAMAGAPYESRDLDSMTFDVAASDSPLSLQVVGTMMVLPNHSYSFNCSFGGAQFAALHVDDHLVCQWGANSDHVATPGQGGGAGCGGGGGHHSCAGIDNPLPVMSRTQWPVRMQLLYIPLPGSPSAGGNTLSIRVQNTPATFVSTLPESEMRRHAVQQSLLQGWGLFYDMSYIDAVRLPEGIRVKFAVCQTAPGGQCLANARMDWPDTSGLSAALRPGLHAYDRTYTQMYVAVEGCNISLTTGGGAGGELHVLVEAEDQLPPLHRVGGSVDNHSTGVERCSQFLNNTDYPGHDLTKIDHVASKEACCNLCANNSLCSAGSWDGPASKWASSATCNLKTAAPSSGKTVAPGMWAFVLRSPPPPPACAGLALVPVGLTTWFRANTAAAVSSRHPELESGVNVHTGAGHDAITFTSAGLGQTTVYSTAIADSSLVINNSLTSTSGAAHLIYPLAHGSKIGFYSPADGSAARAKSLAEITTTLAAARAAEQSTYSKYGELAETKTAVQSAVMWQVVFNPLEAGPFAPVIRGNPWGLDKGVVNDDWPYVIFDWDNHFGAYMLSLDAKELGYSALIQVVKQKTAEGFVPNTAASVNKARHSQPPVGSKILLEIFRKYGEQWLVELLFDDLYDWNSWFDAARKLDPLGIICLGSEEGVMQDARFESGLDNSPMYDSGGCEKTRGAAALCGAWNCSSTGVCGDFRDGKMQLYDVGMASMHTMDSLALAELAAAIGRTKEGSVLSHRATTMAALIEENLWDDAAGIYVNKMPDGRWNRRVSPTSFYALQTNSSSSERVGRLMSEWLLSKQHFCISRSGDFSGNDDACYYGLPSIDRSDPAFPKLGYWRGYVWGPMAQLTYWGLQNYRHVPEADTGRRALCSQMRTMMLEQWRNNGFICENYFPAKGHQGCSPGAMHFYHWGALSGFISLLDAGFY